MQLVPCVVFVVVLGLAQARAQDPAMQSAWRGYDTGTHSGPSTWFPVAQALADFDGEGSLDAAFANQGDSISPAVSVIRGDAQGGYAAPEIYATPTETAAIVAADFTGDGRADLAASQGSTLGGSGCSFLRNLGNGLFASVVVLPTGPDPQGLVAVDDDLDGDLDLALAINAATAAATVVIKRNDGAGLFTDGPTLAAGQAPRGLTAADLDVDGETDLVVQNDSLVNGWRLRVLLNTGGAGFAVQTVVLEPLFTGGVGARVGVGDVDMDSDLDLVVAALEFKVLRNDGTGHYGVPEPVTGSSTGQPAFTLADVTGDARLDIVHATSGMCETIPGLGDGGFDLSEAQAFSSGDTPVAVDAVDVDGDEDLELLTTCRESLEFVVHVNRGDGDFAPLKGFAANTVAFELTTGDIDSDGDLDAAAGGLGTIGLLRNNGNGTFEPAYQVSNPVGCEDVKLRDLDGDACADLLWVPRGENPPYHFFTKMNDGNGNFGPLQTWPIDTCGNGPVEAFDLDGDNDLDVVVGEHLDCRGVSGSGRRLFLGRNDGTGQFQLLPPVVLNVHPESLAAGDFDEDGVLDLTTGFDLLRGLGNLDFLPVQSVGTAPIWWAVAGDADLDGHLDILGADNGEAGNESAYVVLGDGLGNFGPAQVLFASYSNALAAIRSAAAGDPDDDGDLDLCVGNTGSRDVSFFENPGTGVLLPQARYGVAGSTSSGSGPSEIEFADLNGNGIADVAALADNQQPSSASVFVLADVGGAPDTWTDLGEMLGGSLGLPALVGVGTLEPGSAGELQVSSAKPSTVTVLVIGPSSSPVVFKAGTLIPFPFAFLLPLATTSGGTATLPWTNFPAGLPSGQTLYFQDWIPDSGGPKGWASTNGLLGIVP